MRATAALLLILLLGACKQEPPATTSSAPPATPPPMGGPASTAPASVEGARAGLTYDLPASWRRTPPSSAMRLDQAKIPGAAGEGDLAVFFFGQGGGGSADANLQRWIEQVEGGTPQRESFEANGLKISVVDVSGTLHPSSMGMGPSSPQPNQRLLGAVVEGKGGPWFFKATGPQETLGAEREAFLTMLRGARAVAQ